MTLQEFLAGVLEDQPFTITSVQAELRCDRCGGYWETGQWADWRQCPQCAENDNALEAGLSDRPQTHA